VPLDVGHGSVGGCSLAEQGPVGLEHLCQPVLS